MGPPKGKVEIKDPDVVVDTKLSDDLLNIKTILDATLETVQSPTTLFSNLAVITKEVLGTIGPLGWLEALQNLDTEATKLVRTFGISKDRAGELTQTIADAIPQFVGIGLDVGDVAETLKGLGETMKVNIMLNAESLTSFAATAEVTKVKQSELAEKFRDVGVSIASIEPKMLDVVKIARQAGVTVQAVSAGVVTNLDKMNLYNFEGGIKGLAKMAAQASRLGVEMSAIFTVVDKVFNPEGAIEFAASLQRLGVTSSQLLDPLRLMDLAQNDPTELQNQIVNMTKEFTRFNKENNQIEILPGAKRRIDEIGKAMGLPAGELQKMAVNAGMFEMKLKQIKFPTDIATKGDRELIATMAQIGKDGIARVRIEETRIGKDGKEEGTGEYIDKLVSELNTDDVTKLAQQQKSNDASMEEIAKDQLTYLKRISANINEVVAAAKYGPASSKTMQDLYSGALGGFERLLNNNIPEDARESKNYRTFTDIAAPYVKDLVKEFLDSDTLKELGAEIKTKINDGFSFVKDFVISSSFGMGGNDTPLIQSLNNPNLNISYEPMTITTDNKFAVDFNVIADDKISGQAIQDINTAISNYFNGPDGTKNMQALLSRIDNIRASNGQKPIFKSKKTD
jgi:hypothetical protein